MVGEIDRLNGQETKSGTAVFSRSFVLPFLVFVVVATILLVLGRHEYPELHTMLDTGMFFLSVVLAALLLDIGRRIERGFPLWLAASFAVAATFEFLHVTATIEWWDDILPLLALPNWLRPTTWSPSAYLLPIGIGLAIWRLLRGERPMPWFLPGLALLGAVLYAVFQYIPVNLPGIPLGITRPAQIGVPMLWAGIAWVAWRMRDLERKLPPIAAMALILAVGNTAFLYSAAGNDDLAMVAHLSRVTGYLVLMLAVMRMASRDMQERIQAERALSRLNAELERRVAERTVQLETLNRSLTAENEERRRVEESLRETDRRLRTHLERLNLLHQVTRAIGERQDLASIFQVVIRSVEDELPADFCTLCLYDPADHVLTVSGVGTRSLGTAMALAMPERARIAIDANGLSRCLTGRLVYEPDLTALQFPFPQRLLQGGLHAMVLAPLQVESTVFGVLIAARREANSFSSAECEFLRQLSEHVALAAHQAQLHGALQRAYDDLRLSQQSVIQQERLRVLGQMASGIAHDINNALTPASLYTEALLEDDKTLSATSRELLGVVHRAIGDVTQTVARMREFYRQHDAQVNLAPIALNDLVRQVVDLTRARWHDMPMQRGIVVEMKLDLAADLPPMQGVESEIREALINLLLNAVDAMPNGGRMVLATTAEPATEGRAPKIHCEVRDTGAGMDDETRRRCLEPFFTTKGERGTGLGLAMVYGVLQRHGADLEIDSTVGRGTTMRMVFPAIDPARTKATGDSAEPERPQRLPLLVIDDDPILLQTLRVILENDGHAVTTANGGDDGITAFRDAQRAGRPVAAVITDLGMPNIDGRKVAAAIKADSPDTPIILLTGWGQRLIDDDEAPAHVDRVLSKPPKLRDLRQALLEVTAGKA
ncbi:ATP-binding protein [Dongia sedimenti]|uniref:histidine kinase n=1 Tax=Dongia sedimenti TaxID=3064282 RepID=A0ABU0YFI5_9PROT|nr:response regulator [Rhodospirillaceae bacterium R-7]